MPELSRLAGMIIYMYFNDNVHHNKPHIHIKYGEYNAVVGVDGELISGELPGRQLKIIVGWLALYEEEVYAAWNKAVQGLHYDKIEPLEGKDLLWVKEDTIYASYDIPYVKSAEPLENMQLLLTFNNGERKVYDAGRLRGLVFEPLKDEKVFHNVKVVDGVVTWLDGSVDIAPESAYLESADRGE